MGATNLIRNTSLALLAGLLLTASTVVRADYQTDVLSKGPVGYWRLNDSVAAPIPVMATNAGSLGSAGNGSFVADVMLGKPGALPAQPGNTAAYYPGYLERTRISIPNNNAAFSPSGSFSVEFWAKPDRNTGSVTCPAAYSHFVESPVSRRGWLFYQGHTNTANGWSFRVYTNASSLSSLVDAGVYMAIDTNSWYHVVGVYDAAGPSLALYVNGVLQTNTPMASAYVPVLDTTINLTLGCRSDGTFGFAGKLDEPAVYPVALSGTQIAAHYQAGTNSSPSTPYQTVIGTDGPTGYWRLNEKLGPDAANLAGAGTPGQYVATTTPGVAGPVTPAWSGFTAANKAVSISSATPGSVRLPPLNLSTNTVTMTAWVKPSGPQNPYAGIVFQWANVPALTSSGLMVGKDGGLQLGYTWNNTASTYDFPSTISLPANQWSFVALSVSPNSATLMAHDGTTLQTNVNIATHAAQGFQGLTHIGMDPFDPANATFNGSVDEVAIFNRTLSVGELYSLYASAKGGLAPTIFVEPSAPAVVFVGEPLTLSVDAGGTPNLTYQWRKGGSPLAGRTNSSYTIPSLVLGDAGDYAVVVTNPFGTATSALVVITVQPQVAPTILVQPVGKSVYRGGYVNLSVTADGGNLKYQWKKDGSDVAGATSSSYVIYPAAATNAGSYVVIVSNRVSTATSDSAVVGVTVPAPGSYEDIISTNLPISWWRLDEPVGSSTFVDSMGRFDGSWVNSGGVTLGVTGAITGSTNTAVYLNRASSSYGSIPFTPQLNVPTFSIEFWAYTTNTVDDLAAVGSYVANPVAKGWFILRSGANQWGPRLASGGKTYLLLPEGPAYVARWNHFVMTVSPSGIQSYINGLREGTTEFGYWDWNDSAPFRIGADAPGASSGNNYWDGILDEIVYYPTVLSSNDVVLHYQAGRYGSTTPPVFLTQPRSQTAAEGTTVSFTPEVEGTKPITFGWWKDGNPIAGANNMTLTFNSVSFADAGTYVLRATNSVGNAQSVPAVLTVVGQPTFANVTNGLVLHLEFDGNYTDSSGRGNNGTASPSPSPSFTTGLIGSGALQVASTVTADTNTFVTNLTSTSYVTLGVRPDLQFANNVNFSVAYWIKYTNVIGDLPIFGNSESSLSSWGHNFSPNFSGGIGWSLNDDASDRRFESTQVVNDGQWHHVAVSIERTGEISTYIDGALIDRQLGYDRNVDNFQQCVIGQANTLAYSGFTSIAHGTATSSFEVDDLGVWRRALTGNEAYTMWYVGKNYGASFDNYGPVMIVMRKLGTEVELIWQAGTLKESTSLGGPWNPVPGAVAPYHKTTPSAEIKFYRVEL